MTSHLEISCAIMTHPLRLHMAQSLARQHPELAARVVVDPDPDGPPSALRTSRLAWRAGESGATHHLVIQDDAMLCQRFLDRVKAAVEIRPHQALSFFTKWSSRTSYMVRLAALVGSSWAPVADRYVPSQALVLPADIAFSLSDFMLNECTIDEPDDDAIARYLKSRGIPSFVTVPNLAEHVPTKSLVGNDDFGHRPSACFKDAFDESDNWSLTAAGFTLIPYASRDKPGGEIQCFAKDDGQLSWTRVSTSTVLRAHGCDEESILDSFTTAISSIRSSHVLMSDIGPSLLYDLWLVASLLGMSLADDPECQRTGSLADDLARPDARRALLTLPGGVLRGYVQPQILQAQLPGLVDLCVAALARSQSKTSG
jgi:hypothetical protein